MLPEDYPEISPQALDEKLRQQTPFCLLDVRELSEVDRAQIRDWRTVVIPLSRLAREGEQAFPPELLERELAFVVICHHGLRSMRVTQWMRSQGWKNVLSLAGGIDAYARQIDPALGFY